MTVSLSVPGMDLTGARIVWEGQGAEPSYGSTYTFTPTNYGSAWVEAEATYTGRNGRLYVFDVVARDPGGEIMRGRHERAVIDETRLLESAAKRR